jgi:hypothetical protein
MRWLWTILLVTACDDLNRPMGHPKSPSLTPESSSSSSSGGVTTDAGTATPDGAPSIQPQPGDIQL